MLAKKHKLPIQNFVTAKGKLVKNSYFSVKIFPSKEDFSRFGVTISLKVSKKATERNYLKRVAYEALKEYYSRIPAADYWITILPPASSLSKERFIAELRSLLILNT